MATIRIIGNPKATILFEGGDNNIEIAFTYDAIGQHGICTRQQVGITWTPLNTGSCANVKWIVGRNTDATSSFQLATDAAGSNVIATAQTDEPFLIPWTGSAELWGKSTPSASAVPIIFQEW